MLSVKRIILKKLKFENRSAIITILISVTSLIIAGISLFYTLKPKDTKLTVKSSYDNCSSAGEKCYQLFVYNNDEAPCFEFKIKYEANDFKEVFLMKNYEKSSLFNAEFKDGIISFPARKPIPINSLSKNNTLWVGYLDNKEIAYFAFIPKQEKLINRKINISCIDYEKNVSFD